MTLGADGGDRANAGDLTQISRRQSAAKLLGCVTVLAALGAALAPSATAAAAQALFQAKVIGLTAMILVQLAHDATPLFTLAVGARATARVHRRACLLVVVAGAALLAVAEPFLSARIDTVAAAWQGLRLVARLSAFLFAATLGAYWDRSR